MRCPSCGADVIDPQALFCSRCGSALAPADEPSSVGGMEPKGPSRTTESSEEAEAPGPDTAAREPDAEGRQPDAGPAPEAAVTAPQGSPAVESEPAPTAPPAARPEQPSGDASGGGSSGGVPVRDFLTALRRSFVAGGWPDAIASAALAFLALLALGALLVVAFKLDVPSVGSGANPIDVLTAIVLIALGCLGAPLDLGGLSVGMVPLGALLVAGAVITWAAASFVRGRDVTAARDRALEGAKVAVPYALTCFVASLLFRIRDGLVPVSTSAGTVLVLALFWGALFGAVGGLRSGGTRPTELPPLDSLRARRPALGEGLAAAGVMLATTGLLAGGAMLLWIIVGLASGEPAGEFTIGDAVAALIYILAALPNLLGLVAALAVGAPVVVGAQVTTGARLVGPLQEFSIFGIGTDALGPATLLLVLIPLGAGLLGGFSARRNTREPRSVAEVVGSAAALYGLALAFVVWLGAVRIGAGIAGQGFARLAADPLLTFVFALMWAGVAGFAGWKLAEMQERSSKPGAEPSRDSSE